MPGIEIILGQKGHFWLQSNFSSLDEKYVLWSIKGNAILYF